MEAGKHDRKGEVLILIILQILSFTDVVKMMPWGGGHQVQFGHEMGVTPRKWVRLMIIFMIILSCVFQ